MTDPLEHLRPLVRSLRDSCLFIDVEVDGRTWTVRVPLRKLHVAWCEEARRVGCVMPRRVGCPRNVGGLFDSVSRAFRSATRAVKRAIPKSVQRAVNRVSKLARGAVRTGKKALRAAKGIVKSDAFAAGLVGASFLVPALAPAAAAAIAAQQMVARGEKAAAAAKQVIRQARAGSKHAQQVMGALRQLR